MLVEECRGLIVGAWQLSVDGVAVEGSPCYTFTPEGRFSVKILSGTFLQDAINMTAGDGTTGRWRMTAAADQIVLQMWTLGLERGLLGRLDAPLTKPFFFLLGRLNPPEECLVVSMGQDVIDLRRRPSYMGRKEVPLQLARRREPV